MTVSIAPLETGDDLARAEDDFFKEILRNTTSDPFSGWEQRANSMGDLLPGEKFHLRHVIKNFDGMPIISTAFAWSFSTGDRVATRLLSECRR